MNNNCADTGENERRGDVVLKKNFKETTDSKKTNIEVMEDAEQTKSLVIRIGRRHVAFIDHKTRRKGLEHLLVTEGRWGRGRQRTNDGQSC